MQTWNFPKKITRAHSITKGTQELKIESLEGKSLGYHIIGLNVSVELKILKHDNQQDLNIFRNSTIKRGLVDGRWCPYWANITKLQYQPVDVATQ